MKNNLDYFGHDVDAHNHPKFKALRAQYGWEGYGKFWALNEKIGAAERCSLDLSRKVMRASIADDLGFSLIQFDEFIDFLADPEECGLIHKHNSIITTERTQENLTLRSKDRESARKRYQKTTSPEKVETSPEDSNSSPDLRPKSDTKQSKAKQIKLNSSMQACTAAAGVVDNLLAAGIHAPPGETEIITANLSEHGLDPGFIPYAAGESRKRQDIKHPPGFVRTMLGNLRDYPDWIAEYKSRPPARDPPPGTCPVCGQPFVKMSTSRAECSDCGIFDYDPVANIWVDDDGF